MTSNSDTSDKGGKPGTEVGKKPSALIDLKATEVDIKDPAKTSPSEPKAAATAAEAAAKATSAAQPAKPSSAPEAKPDTKPETKPGASAAATKPPTVDSSKPTGAATSPKPAPAASAKPASSGGGLRGALTHLVAGLAGGLLALLGAEPLLQHLGKGADTPPPVSAAVEARLRSLEQASSRPVAPELTQRLTTAESRLAAFEQAAKSLGQQHAQLSEETRSLTSKVTSTPAPESADAARLAKLEETLSTLAEAAKSEQPGRIPQLAAIAGKLTDLETSLATQITQMRKAVTQEVDSRLSQSADAAQAARAGTQRLDREFASVKNDAAQITQRMDTLTTQADRLEKGLQGLREASAALKGQIDQDMKQVARTTDVSTAIAPVTTKLASLEQNVQGVVRNEDDRRANVERIVTALELGNLKRTIERGGAFGKELNEVRRVAGPKIDLSILDRYKETGVATTADLEREFKPVAFAMLDADSQPADASWTDRLLSSAKSVVRVRKLDQNANDTSAEAMVARMEQALKAGRLADVQTEAAKLSPRAREAGKAWLAKVEAKASIERAIAAIEQDLKASLGAQGQAGKKG